MSWHWISMQWTAAALTSGVATLLKSLVQRPEAGSVYNMLAIKQERSPNLSEIWECALLSLVQVNCTADQPSTKTYFASYQAPKVWTPNYRSLMNCHNSQHSVQDCKWVKLTLVLNFIQPRVDPSNLVGPLLWTAWTIHCYTTCSDERAFDDHVYFGPITSRLKTGWLAGHANRSFLLWGDVRCQDSMTNLNPWKVFWVVTLWWTNFSTQFAYVMTHKKSQLFSTRTYSFAHVFTLPKNLPLYMWQQKCTAFRYQKAQKRKIFMPFCILICFSSTNPILQVILLSRNCSQQRPTALQLYWDSRQLCWDL